MPVPLPAPITPAPSAPTAASLQACEVDSDCRVHFRTSACFPGDPIGVNVRDPAAVRTIFPVKRQACAMGGPQYERQRMANEGRYGAVCKLDRCEVVDRGPRQTIPF